MNDMEYVENVIDGMIQDYEHRRRSDDCDALDQSYYNCSIGTLRVLKSRLGLAKYNV